MAQADEDKDAEALVLLEVVCAAAIAATTARLLCGRDHAFEKKMGLLLLYLEYSGSMKDAGLALGISKPYAMVYTAQVGNVFIISKPHAVGWMERDYGWLWDVRGFPYVYGAVDDSLFEIARHAEILQRQKDLEGV
ncbi:hypothetical protein PI124_g11978 [Phytophthora idaei]|nr:hypothetical protein PI125_g11517 [Phytophthora idaei]KAG3157829.1 hypothetical protein PI126_g8116 [Phytophthora idaei]KAG3243190.1 hypothetical protein PI124_g11978 [Phytophthora idaei]